MRNLMAIVSIVMFFWGCDAAVEDNNNANNGFNNNVEPVCGNGFVELGSAEQCDGADLNGATCESIGQAGGGELGCRTNCIFDASLCHSNVCGNGVLDEGEECDPGDSTVEGVISEDATATCADFGWYYGELGCSSDCTLSNESSCSGRCGDGILDEGFEFCDTTNLDPDTGIGFEGLVLRPGNIIPEACLDASPPNQYCTEWCQSANWDHCYDPQ